jgi:hypothetical protein
VQSNQIDAWNQILLFHILSLRVSPKNNSSVCKFFVLINCIALDSQAQCQLFQVLISAFIVLFTSTLLLSLLEICFAGALNIEL